MRKLRMIVLILLVTLCAVSSGRAQTTTVRSAASLMAAPGSTGVVLDILSPGMAVEVITVEANWARIRIPATSEVGWVETGALAREAGAPGILGQDGMTPTELGRVRGRVQMMSSGMQGIEQRVDSLLFLLTGGDSPAGEMVSGAETGESESYRGGALAYGFPYDAGEYRWSNQFVMGTYLRGGQSYYGLTLSRALDSRGRNLLLCRAQYGLGEIRGNADDFIDWTLGMDFNLFPESYVVYPFFGAHFGMRHMFEEIPAGRDFLIAAPTIGMRADLGGVFILGAELRGLFRFEKDQRRDDGMVGFTAGYRW